MQTDREFILINCISEYQSQAEERFHALKRMSISRRVHDESSIIWTVFVFLALIKEIQKKGAVMIVWLQQI